MTTYDEWKSTDPSDFEPDWLAPIISDDCQEGRHNCIRQDCECECHDEPPEEVKP